MSAEEAAEFVNIIAPEFAVPVHYGSVVGKPEDAEIFIKNLNSGIQAVLKVENM